MNEPAADTSSSRPSCACAGETIARLESRVQRLEKIAEVWANQGQYENAQTTRGIALALAEVARAMRGEG